MSSNERLKGTYVPAAEDDALRPRGGYRFQRGANCGDEVVGVIVNLE